MTDQKITRRVTSESINDFSFVVNNTPKFLVDWFADSLTAYFNGGVSVEDGQTMQFEFTTVKFCVRNRRLTILAPDYAEMPVLWIENMDHALSIVTAHKYTPESVGMTPDTPTMLQSAVVGQRFNELPFIAERSERMSDNPNDSGWFVGTMCDEVDNTDATNLHCLSLYELITKLPQLVQFVSLPVGCKLLFESRAPTIFKDDQIVHVPPDSYLGRALAKADR